MITDNMKSYDYEPLSTQNSATPMQQQNLGSASPMQQDNSTAAPALKESGGCRNRWRNGFFIPPNDSTFCAATIDFLF